MKVKNGIQPASLLTAERFISNRNVLPTLTPALVRKLSYTSALFTYKMFSLLQGALVQWTIQRVQCDFTEWSIFFLNQKRKMSFERTIKITSLVQRTAYRVGYIYVYIYMQDLYNCQSTAIGSRASDRSKWKKHHLILEGIVYVFPMSL